MASINFKIVYDSGDTVDINPNRPRALLEFERHWGVPQPEEGSAHQVEQLLWLCWAALGKPASDFEAWIDTVADFEIPDAAELMAQIKANNGAAPKAPSRGTSRKQRSQAK